MYVEKEIQRTVVVGPGECDLYSRNLRRGIWKRKIIMETEE
jgi:hypothetical protein